MVRLTNALTHENKTNYSYVTKKENIFDVGMENEQTQELGWRVLLRICINDSCIPPL